ncbi:NmrA family NAD(P)-binding protein [Sinorhizobium sp. Sb3]|uniref:NmrA family NAD(P)-binding protein n=1 Tax=Sinorhizobium/Ensifer group TaxID=227292 RepID=UPI002477EA3E|nr:NmrA family NAD(P)-binding protein [Sinorhizobium sp. Sb3]
MNQRSNTILVVGATGRFADLVVPELARRGAKVRALIRDETHGALAKSLGASEIAIGDLRERGSLDRALEGAAGVFHLPSRRMKRRWACRWSKPPCVPVLGSSSFRRSSSRPI